MILSELLLAVYEATLTDESALKCFNRLNKVGMKSVNRADFEAKFESFKKYPTQAKVAVISARRNELLTDVVEVMLKVDPPWAEAMAWGHLCESVGKGPEQLREVIGKIPAELAERCKAEWPEYFA